MPAIDIWQERTLPGNPHIFSVAYGNNTYVAVGSGIFISSDGSSWISRRFSRPLSLEDVTFDGGRFIAILG